MHGMSPHLLHVPPDDRKSQPETHHDQGSKGGILSNGKSGGANRCGEKKGSHKDRSRDFTLTFNVVGEDFLINCFGCFIPLFLVCFA